MSHKVPDRVLNKLKDLPDQPGVYFMRDRNGKVIYVGKAKSLRNRVRSYFQPSTLRTADGKTRSLIHSIHDFDFITVASDADAVLTEGNLIKEYRPYYNAYFKDDKRFLMLKVNRAEPFPRFTTARIRKSDGAEYFGPYAAAGAARTALEFIEKRFGLRQCRPRVPNEENYKHCHNDILRFCSAPCVGKISPEDYKGRVEEACAFLRGERSTYLKEIFEAMDEASSRMEFERAAELRDTARLLQKAIKQRIQGKKTLFLKPEQAETGACELRDALQLAQVPTVIETFDISNISGTHAVGSMVCAVKGNPQRNRYRLFRIKTVEGIDDPAMMGEVIRRRYGRILREGKSLPDLVIVDGGITQLRAAKRELKALGLEEQPIVGLAKRFEELVLDEEEGPRVIRLPRDSLGLKIVQQIRDEAHRFALTYHRRLREKRIRESFLDEVDGIGDKRKQQLLKHFGSVRRLSRATQKEIHAVPGVGEAMAELIYQTFHPES